MKQTCFHPRILGVIGGMGPFADTAFLDILNSATDCACDQGHIPIILDGNCQRPDRSAFIMKKSSKSPYKSLFSSMRFLERHNASVIVMPCNTAHCFLPYLLKQKKKRTVIINMVYESARQCFENGLKNVCLLCTEGTKKADLFGEYFFRLGIDVIYPDKKTSDFVSDFIYRVKCGNAPCFDRLETCIRNVRCDAFLLGCTELSYALHRSGVAELKYIDSLSCLAKRTLEVFGKNAKSIPYT